MQKLLPYSIQWYEGMLLSPQHFQHHDNVLRKILTNSVEAVTIFYYGIKHLEIDKAALSAGVLRIISIEAILPDGAHVLYDVMTDDPLSIDLSGYFAINQDPILVNLAMAKHSMGQNSVFGEVQRYYGSTIENLTDENTNESQSLNVTILKPKLRLLLTKDFDARFDGFPLVEVKKNSEGGICLSDYIPPQIMLKENSNIIKLCKSLISEIREKIQYFTSRTENFSNIADQENSQTIRLLIQSVLPLESICRIVNIHPFELYKVLIESMSKLISINYYQSVPLLPVYNHQDAFQVFDSLCSYGHRILKNIKQHYCTVLFEYENNIFKLAIEKTWLDNEELFVGIRKSPSCTEQDILKWISGAQIASKSMVNNIKDKRVLGADRRIVGYGEKITPPFGTLLLAIKTHTIYINPFEQLCIFNSSNELSKPEEMVLYVEQ